MNRLRLAVLCRLSGLSPLAAPGAASAQESLQGLLQPYLGEYGLPALATNISGGRAEAAFHSLVRTLHGTYAGKPR